MNKLPEFFVCYSIQNVKLHKCPEFSAASVNHDSCSTLVCPRSNPRAQLSLRKISNI